jgi:hypothetical protein
MKKAENFVRTALSVRSDKRVSDAKVRSVAKKVSRAFPMGWLYVWVPNV